METLRATAGLPHYTREGSATFLTRPGWSTVHSTEEYAVFLATRPPGHAERLRVPSRRAPDDRGDRAGRPRHRGGRLRAAHGGGVRGQAPRAVAPDAPLGCAPGHGPEDLEIRGA